MHIDNHINNPVRISELKSGDPFICDGSIYIKARKSSEMSGEAVELDSGWIVTFNLNEEVFKVVATVTVEKIV